MKKHLIRNAILMAVATLIMGVFLSLYIANTGTVPAADNAAASTASSTISTPITSFATAAASWAMVPVPLYKSKTSRSFVSPM